MARRSRPQSECIRAKPSERVPLKRLLQVVFALLASLVLCEHAAAQAPYTREMALKAMDASSWMARHSLNDPKALNNVLIWDMARPAGDDPRVLDTCIYVIDHTTNTESASVALSALELVASKAPKGKPLIAATLQRIYKRENFQLQIAVVRVFLQMGDEYRAAGYQLGQDILKRYRTKVPDETLVRQVPYLETVPESFQLASDVIEKSTNSAAVAQAVDDLRGPIEQGANETSSSKTESYLRLLRIVLKRKDMPLLLRTKASGILSKAGDGCREEAYRANLNLLQDPGDITDPTSSFAYTSLLRKILNLKRSDSIAILRQTIRDHHDVIVKEYERSIAHRNKESKQVREATAELARIEAIADGSEK